MIKNVFVAAALCSACAAFAAPNIVVDGSFEAVNQPNGSYGYYYAPGVPGWTVSGGQGDSIEIRDDLVGTAQDGVNFVELDSEHNSAMSQTLGTVAGQLYSLSFWYSNRAQSNDYNAPFAGGVVPASTQGLSFDVGSGAVAVGALPDNTTTDNQWVEYSTTFLATSSQTTLTFAALGTSDSWGSSLDNVVVAAVPEPAPTALMAGGLLLLAGLTRRRQNGR